jgi:hypothetical protein
MTANDYWALVAILAAVGLFLVYCPLLKPWFGFRRPPGHRGRWWT